MSAKDFSIYALKPKPAKDNNGEDLPGRWCWCYEISVQSDRAFPNEIYLALGMPAELNTLESADYNCEGEFIGERIDRKQNASDREALTPENKCMIGRTIKKSGKKQICFVASGPNPSDVDYDISLYKWEKVSKSSGEWKELHTAKHFGPSIALGSVTPSTMPALTPYTMPALAIDKTMYMLGETIDIAVALSDNKKNSIENIFAVIRSTTDRDGIRIMLNETSKDSGIFTQTVSIARGNSSSEKRLIKANVDDNIEVECGDASVGAIVVQSLIG